MDWQQPVALAIVGITAALFLWNQFRPRRAGIFRSGHCGCSSASSLNRPATIIFRARRGERPQIVTRTRPSKDPVKEIVGLRNQGS